MFRISLSICVPSYNEEAGIVLVVEDLLEKISREISNLEIIIVDDGSADRTKEMAEKLVFKYKQVKLIKHISNSGIGSCYRDALAVAGGEYFTWFPADGEDQAEEISACLPYLSSDRVVTCYHLDTDQRSIFRKILSRIYTGILNSFFGLRIKYYNGLAILKTDRARALPFVSNGFFCNAEILIRAVKSGCKLVELSLPLGKRISGKSKALSARSLFMAGKDFICILHNRMK